MTLDFEIQEAVTFRDGAASAFHDVEPDAHGDDAGATRRLGPRSTSSGPRSPTRLAGDAVASPDAVRATTDEALGLIDALYPTAWKEAAKTADFDVIAATLDRLQAAAATGDWKQAEPARLEAYGVFELGPEQRLRGLAPSLFQEVEGYFWYGAGGHDGLVQLLGRRAADEEIAADPRRARRRARALGAADRKRPAVRRLRRHERGDHRLPRGARGGAHPRGAHGEPRRRAAPLPATDVRRRRARARRERA